MPKNKIILDENLICDEYTNSKIGIEALALKYHVGKLKVKAILNKNGISLKKKGAQRNNEIFVIKDFKTEKYPNSKSFHYEVIDSNNQKFRSKDTLNNGGNLTTYISKQYKVEIPTLYYRRMYYMRTGNYWWEQWLTYVKVENPPIKKCPFCDWTTYDVNNKSGAFEQHLNSVHHMSKIKYIEQFPNEKRYFQLADNTNNLQMEKDTDKFITCKICGKKLTKISNRHLKLHNITKEEYILKHGKNDLMSHNTYNKFYNMTKNLNLSMDEMGNEKFTSSAEREIINFINSKGLKCRKDRKILNGKEIDILVMDKNIAIEYDGLYWYTEKHGKDKNYHYNKMLECNKKGIGLIQIFDDEYINHYKIVMNKISHLLHIESDKPKIYARKCEIKYIYKCDAEKFLNEYHIQGFVPSTIYLGCFYKKELIGVMTFKNGGINLNGWELNRFASNYNYRCIGIGGKLFSYFIKHHNVDKVVSFADRRWTINKDNNLYTNIGFKLVNTLKPDYQYYNYSVHGHKHIHKFLLSKTKLLKKYDLNKNLTEWEMAQKLGYDRIWDCGKFKYEWKKEGVE